MEKKINPMVTKEFVQEAQKRGYSYAWIAKGAGVSRSRIAQIIKPVKAFKAWSNIKATPKEVK